MLKTKTIIITHGLSGADRKAHRGDESRHTSSAWRPKVAFLLAAFGMWAVVVGTSSNVATVQQQLKLLQHEGAATAATSDRPASSVRSHRNSDSDGRPGPTSATSNDKVSVPQSNAVVVSEPVSSRARRRRMSERTVTERGVDLTDPRLYETVDLRGDSSTATVAGMASGYDLETYERFVGSLRKSGFKGHIMLGVAPDVSPRILRYLRYRNVTVKVMQWVNCTYTDATRKGDIFQETTCAHPYPDIKIRWSRFPLIRDWLLDCPECTGPVLVVDVRDTLFQLDPFGPGSPALTGLQVYEEHKSQTTEHWLTLFPIEQCLKVRYNETMLCSGSTTGTRPAMIKYLNIMYEEMKYWIQHDECRFDMNGDDQSIHNHLYYSGQLPFATRIENRHNGIVNTVGVEGAIVFNRHKKNMEQVGKDASHPYPGAAADTTTNNNSKPGRWIGTEYNLCNDLGYFTEFDGSVSRVVHQWDRLGLPFVERWLNPHPLFHDPMIPDDDGAKPQ